MKLTTYNALCDTADAPARGSFTVVPTDTVGAYFTEDNVTAVARQLIVFSAGTVKFRSADGVDDTWTIGAGAAFPVAIRIAVVQVYATGTSVTAGDIKALW